MGDITQPYHSKDDTPVGLLDLALVLAEHFRTVVFRPIAVSLVALGISFLIPPTYTAVTRILPPAPQQSSSTAFAAQLGALAGLVGGVTNVKNPVDQYVSLLKSRSVYDALAKRFNLKELYGARYNEDTYTEIENRTKILAGLKDGIISIEVQDHDPKRAAAVANAFVEELRNLSNSLAITEAAQRRLFFQAELEQTRDNLTRAELALRSSGVSAAALKTVPQSALEVLARLKAQITAQEIKLASMRTFMTESHPEFKVAIQELSALRAELLKAEQSNPSKVAGDGADYIAKFRDFKYNETLFELMTRQYELARLDEAREGAVIQVLDTAVPPERKSGPNRALITALAALITFFAAAIVVLVRRSFINMSSDPRLGIKLSRLRNSLHFRRK